MAFGSFHSGAPGARPMSEINMIPLIDVMLVLLVIFIITAPLLTHAVKMQLPSASSNPNIPKPERLQLAINASGTLYWNDETVTRDELRGRFAAAGRQSPQPELQLRADRVTQYQSIAEVLADATLAGLTRIGFVSDPAPASTP
ncbi:MAG TPA: biopolymer transporter ExbD [Casimicrobiaceae bacterium]|jgi:biopolymer transport protein ExbD